MTPRTVRFPCRGRIRLSAALMLAGGLALSACATDRAAAPESELARLTADCKARGGILMPSGATTGREAVDNVCRISGGPSDRLRPQN